MAPGRPPRGHPDHAAARLGNPAACRRAGCGEGSDGIALFPGAIAHPAALLARAAELAAAERPFALATVVAVRRPTSAKPGAHGIIHPDRTIEGWVGGSCAQPIVVREAMRSLEDGQPRLLRLSPEGTSEGQRADGVLEFVMTCHSKGTLEVYIEPHLPRPALWVAGTTPIATALVELGASAGYRVTLVDRAAAGDPGAFPAAERVLGEVDLAALDPEVTPSIVVATQGQWDEDALDRALRRDRAGYVGLIASPLRAEAVRDYLRDVGIPEDRLADLHAPAGLDLGAETPEEVALSILAELVQLRRQGRASNASTDPGPSARPVPVPIAIEPAPLPADIRVPGPPMVLVDPVCGMTVEPADVRHTAEHEGITYAFCCAPCRRQFSKNPEAFLAEALAAEAATPA